MPSPGDPSPPSPHRPGRARCWSQRARRACLPAWRPAYIRNKKASSLVRLPAVTTWCANTPRHQQLKNWGTTAPAASCKARDRDSPGEAVPGEPRSGRGGSPRRCGPGGWPCTARWKRPWLLVPKTCYRDTGATGDSNEGATPGPKPRISSRHPSGGKQPRDKHFCAQERATRAFLRVLLYKELQLSFIVSLFRVITGCLAPAC